ncbi:hypothetical protein [Chryseobacterium bernardetii]|uniref:hypothetical protein n=1 Tax=Chryseobacterium bernardetii TaxID=1241978 RepID=UPI003AF598F1
MKKLLFILLISAFSFAQQTAQVIPASYQVSKKVLVKEFSYQDLITFFNSKMQIQNEDLSENINRCKYIIQDAKAKQDFGTVQAFSFILNGLQQADKMGNKNDVWFKVYDNEGSYNFYTGDEKFIGRVYKEKLDEDFSQNPNKNEVFLMNFMYISIE